MNYRQAIRYPFTGERWFVNLLLILVAALIPILGSILLLGFGTVVVKRILRDPTLPPPRFDFKYFSKYLERGISVFVVALICSVVFIPVIFLCWVPFIVLAIVAASNHGMEWLMPVGMGGAILLETIAIVVLCALMVPFQIKSELEGEIGKAFDFKFARDFLKRMWKTMVVMTFAMWGLGFLGMIIGFCMCFFGIYIVMAALFLVQWHLQAQLYRLHLERGGIAVEIKEDPVLDVDPAAFPAVVN